MMRIQHGFPKKFVNGNAVTEKRGAERVTRVERVVHDWLYENTGRYPLIHYFDDTGKFYLFKSYLAFEKKFGKAKDHDAIEDAAAAVRARRAKLKTAWARPETRKRHASAYSKSGRKRFRATMKEILKSLKLKEKK
jgi:hypothetical protein